ncbi:MAG TPA: hypothetical protein VKR06_00015 [Ktedonosporobacter sp.]|nr:hypothetical protein [Ktedonosporobacter sp.]
MQLLFVHGVQTRQDAFGQIMMTVREGIRKIRSDVSLKGFYWGDTASALHYGGSSIPGYFSGTRAIDTDTMESIHASNLDQLNALLLDNPYLELLALKDPDDFNPTGAGFEPIPPEVEERNQRLQAVQSDVAEKLGNEARLQSLLDHKPGQDAITRLTDNAFDYAGRMNREIRLPDLIEPLDRCLTAGLYQLTTNNADPLGESFPWVEVEGIVHDVLDQELGGQKGIIGDAFKNLALMAVTSALRQGLRRKFMQTMSMFIGDVLVYLAKREDVLDQLDRQVASMAGGEPLWLVGHSLGGVICYDYGTVCSREIERLVTVGSQVGLLGEFGALKTRPDLTGCLLHTPDKIATWLNIYDPDDMLSFLAQPVFDRVVDIEVDTRAPFPVSHSAYWFLPEVFDKIFMK